jgi:hypothetical protein
MAGMMQYLPIYLHEKPGAKLDHGNGPRTCMVKPGAPIMYIVRSAV